MERNEINPYIRVAKRSVLPAGFTISNRALLDYELLYLEKGELELFYYDRVFSCREGDFLLLCPGVSHRFFFGDRTVFQPHIHFDLCYDSFSEKRFICYRDLPDMSESDRRMLAENAVPACAKQPFLQVADQNRLRRLFFSVVDSPDPNALSVKAEMLRLLEMIFPEQSATQHIPVKTDPAVALRSYLETNCNQNVSLDEIAGAFCYSKFYLERCFRERYGQSVISYRNQVCMNRAQALLPDYRVGEVAEMLKFTSIYSFSRAFKNTFGYSPSQVQQRHEKQTDT